MQANVRMNNKDFFLQLKYTDTHEITWKCMKLLDRQYTPTVHKNYNQTTHILWV